MAKPKQKYSKNTCDGCGKHFELRTYPTRQDYSCKVKVGPGTSVAVCGSDRGAEGYYERDRDNDATPKLVCLRKAYEAKNVCPGCGEDRGHRGPFQQVCPDCRELLIRARTALGDKPEQYLLDHSLVAEHYPSNYIAQPLLLALARVAAATGPRRFKKYGHAVNVLGRLPGWASDGGGVITELDDGQKAAMLEVGPLIKTFVDAMYNQGRQDGRNLLAGLAEGRMSISEFEEQHQSWHEDEGDDPSGDFRDDG